MRETQEQINKTMDELVKCETHADEDKLGKPMLASIVKLFLEVTVSWVERQIENLSSVIKYRKSKAESYDRIAKALEQMAGIETRL